MHPSYRARRPSQPAWRYRPARERIACRASRSAYRTRYFLFEAPRDVLPPRLLCFSRRILDAGFVPILTHPERLSWVAGHYGVVRELAASGVLMQLTAGSLTGDFGRSIGNLAARMLHDGLCDVVSSDAHGATSRRPGLSRARAFVAARLGEAEAELVVAERPRAILENRLVVRPLGAGRAPGHAPETMQPHRSDH